MTRAVVRAAAAFRAASLRDAQALTDLERAANLVALRHVFDPARHAFPDTEVHARWGRLLRDPEVVVEVAEVPGDGRGSAVCLLARDSATVRHLAVHPHHWRRGLASTALGRAEAAIRAGGAVPRLWCLVLNVGARRLYEGRGWQPAGRERPAEFAPYPVEMEHELR